MDHLAPRPAARSPVARFVLATMLRRCRPRLTGGAVVSCGPLLVTW